jgi:hypothetical protein
MESKTVNQRGLLFEKMPEKKLTSSAKRNNVWMEIATKKFRKGGWQKVGGGVCAATKRDRQIDGKPHAKISSHDVVTKLWWHQPD